MASMHKREDDDDNWGEQIGTAVLDAILKAPDYAEILLDPDADQETLLFNSLARVHFLYVTLLATARSVVNDEDALRQINETVLQTMLVCLRGRIDPVGLSKIMRTDLPLMTEEYLEQFENSDFGDAKVMAVGTKRTQ